MLILAYATVASAILAIILAVARDVPVFHLILPPDTTAGDRMVWAIALPLFVVLVACLTMTRDAIGLRLFTAAWLTSLVYFWWVAAWHLRERR